MTQSCNYSSQVKLVFIYIVQNLTSQICDVIRPLALIRKNLPNILMGEKEETLGRATDDGSLFQNIHTCRRRLVYRVDS